MKIPDDWRRRLRRLAPPDWRSRLHRVLRDVIAVFSAIRNPQVPWSAKAVALASVLYLVMPVDLIPDVVPVLGWADDIALVPLACFLASKLISPGVMNGLRSDAEFTLLRWGPKLKIVLVVFVAGWLLMAVVGGCMMFRRDRPAGAGADKGSWEERMLHDFQRR